jgi:hypothetical protein
VRGHFGHGLSEYDHDYNYSLLAALEKCVLGVGHEHFLASCLSFFFKALYHGIEHSSRIRGEHVLGRLEYGIWLQEWTVCMNENGWEL